MTNEQYAREQDLYEHHRIVVDKGQHPQRIDKFLTDRLPDTSRNRIQNAAIAGNIIVQHGKEKSAALKPSYKVKPGDVISVVLPFPPKIIEIIPENIPLDIVFEDEHVIVVNKQANLVVHPAYGNYSGTLVNALAYHFQKPATGDTNPFKPIAVLTGEGDAGLQPRPGLVHRLDKNTSGLMVVAKTDLALTKLAKQFYDRTVSRQYLALVWGDFDRDSGTITGNIGRNLKNRKVMAVFPDGDHGKHAVTHFNVTERFGYVTLISCRLETGRTHQIRVHFSHIGHPLFNDEEYGGNKIVKGELFSRYAQFVKNCFKILGRQALHAVLLGFNHPLTGKKMIFESELPTDMKELIEKWEKYARNV